MNADRIAHYDEIDQDDELYDCAGQLVGIVKEVLEEGMFVDVTPEKFQHCHLSLWTWIPRGDERITVHDETSPTRCLLERY